MYFNIISSKNQGDSGSPVIKRVMSSDGPIHYLKAVQAAGTNKTESVMGKMRELPVEFFGTQGRVREDGRMVHDMYLFEIKKPEQSSGPWDYFTLRATIPAEQAFQPLANSTCPLLER